MLDGRAAMRQVKRFPVPSMPGKSTSWVRSISTQEMLAAAAIPVTQNGDFGRFEAVVSQNADFAGVCPTI